MQNRYKRHRVKHAFILSMKSLYLLLNVFHILINVPYVSLMVLAAVFDNSIFAEFYEYPHDHMPGIVGFFAGVSAAELLVLALLLKCCSINPLSFVASYFGCEKDDTYDIASEEASDPQLSISSLLEDPETGTSTVLSQFSAISAEASEEIELPAPQASTEGGVGATPKKVLP